MPKVLIFLAAVLCGCAKMIYTSGDSDFRNGPMNAEARGGVVRYINQGPWKRNHRQAAFDKMAARCGGPYKIVDESPRVIGEDRDEYLEIKFLCVN
jgi:hypothetical protein